MVSLRRHLTRSVLGAILVLGALGAAALYFTARDVAIDQFDDTLRAKAAAISTLTQPVVGGVRVTFTDRFFRGFEERDPRDYFEIWNAEGQPIARSESLGRSDLPVRTELKTTPRFWNADLPGGGAGRAIGFRFRPRRPRDAPPGIYSGDLSIIVESSAGGLSENLWLLGSLAAGSSLVVLLATLWLIPRVLRRGLEPLERLAGEVAATDSRSLGRRFEVAGLPRELQPIAAGLNELLGRIEASFERERQFTADLAHELRTPLAELRSAAECALKWPGAREARADEETLAIAGQMEGMVARMLAIARSEQGLLGLQNEPVELHRLAQQRWDRVAGRAAERQLQADLRLDPATVEADPVLLRSILDNLFENAVEHAVAPGRIGIASGGSPGWVRVSNGADLSPEDCSHLFERFWRKEAARSARGHVGLGLPLAQGFAAAMGWTLAASQPEPGRLEFLLRAAPDHPGVM